MVWFSSLSLRNLFANVQEQIKNLNFPRLERENYA